MIDAKISLDTSDSDDDDFNEVINTEQPKLAKNI